MFAHVHSTGRGYFSHAGGWYELVNVETNGVVGTGTQRYNLGALVSTSTTATSLNVSGVTTAVTVDINGDLDVDGHTNLDNVNIAGVSTFASSIYVADSIIHEGDTDTKIDFTTNVVKITAANKLRSEFGSPTNYNTLYGSTNFTGNTATPKASAGYIVRFRDEGGDDTVVRYGNTNVKNAVLEWNDYGSSTTAGNLVFRGWDGGIEGGRFDGSGNFKLNHDLDVSGNSVLQGDLDVDGHTNLDNVSVAGVTTFSDTVNVGTGVTIFTNGRADFTGFTTFSAGAQIPFNKNLIIGPSSLYGSIKYPNGFSGLQFDALNKMRFRCWDGNSMERWLEVAGVNGVITLGGFSMGAVGSNSVPRIQIQGANHLIKMFSSEPNSTTLTERFSLSQSGINFTGLSTHTGNFDLDGDLDVDGHTNLDNVNIVGVTTHEGHVLPSADSTYDLGSSSKYWRHVYADNIGVGTDGTTIGVDIVTRNLKVNGISTHVGIATFNDATFHKGINVTGVSTFAQTIKFPDASGGVSSANAPVAIFGTHSDLKIGHDSSNSRIFHNGAGNLIISSNNSIQLSNASTNHVLLNATAGGSVLLRHNNSSKLETTAQGIEVTGLTDTDTLNTGNATFTGTITAGGATGNNGQYLKTTGTGVAWASFPTLRTRDTVTASAGQTTFTFNYTVNFIDVYVNGIKLTDTEFTATNGTSVVLAVGCFVGDIVELVSYNGVSTGSASGSLNNVVEDVTPQLGGNLDLLNKTINGTGNINIVGVATATKFIGDGSGLTGVTASGSGIIVKDSGTLVGTAQTIDFGSNLSLSPASAGIVTVTATQLTTEEVQDIVGAMFTGNTETNITATYQDSDGTIDLVASNANIGITTNLSGSFTASAGSASNIDSYAYSADDAVVEYTVFIKNGSNFQSQKLLAMRDGTTTHSTQFAVMFSSSLLVQFDTTISGGNIILRATPETGVSGSTTYRVKREVL